MQKKTNVILKNWKTFTNQANSDRILINLKNSKERSEFIRITEAEEIEMASGGAVKKYLLSNFLPQHVAFDIDRINGSPFVCIRICIRKGSCILDRESNLADYTYNDKIPILYEDFSDFLKLYLSIKGNPVVKI